MEQAKLLIIWNGALTTPQQELEPFLIGVLLAPLAEEFLFRGLLYRCFAAQFASHFGVLIAIVFSSLAFALWHVPFFQAATPPALDVRMLMPHFAFGMSMALLRYGSGGILLGLLLHAAFNGLAVAHAG